MSAARDMFLPDENRGCVAPEGHNWQQRYPDYPWRWCCRCARWHPADIKTAAVKETLRRIELVGLTPPLVPRHRCKMCGARVRRVGTCSRTCRENLEIAAQSGVVLYGKSGRHAALFISKEKR